MKNAFDKLSAEDKALLLKAPVLFSILVASHNHEITQTEKAEAIKLAHLKTFTAHPLLLDYYNQVEIDFVKHFEETVEKYTPFDDAHIEALKQEINSVHNVISKLDMEFSIMLQKSLSKFAEHVNKLERNILIDFIFPFSVPGLTD